MTATLQTPVVSPRIDPIAMPPQATHTPEDVLALEDQGLYELVDGRLVEKQMSMLATKVAGLLITELNIWARGGKADVFPEASFQCFAHEQTRTHRPDVAVVLAGRLLSGPLPPGHGKIRPDVAVEVISPDDKVSELIEKLEDYERAGFPVVWVIYPEARFVERRRGTAVTAVFRESDALEAPEVLPGFAVRVADLLPPVPAVAAS